ncbi:MAG: class II aldolase/adducin family protein [Rhodoferax sp.]|nr:class II aldolase/adducin family protein [Rhodoferax sp.]
MSAVQGRPKQARTAARQGEGAPASDDGVIRYQAQHQPAALTALPGWEHLNQARTALYDLGLIGAYPDGVGYGNLSLRGAGNTFVITGSGTGGLRELTLTHYCSVEDFNAERNWVCSRGPVSASSESMTHGAIYQAKPAAQCVMHVHSRSLFDMLLQQGAAHTPADVPYGTPAMAQAVAQLVQAQPELPALFAMAGHDEGVVAYGADIASTLALLVNTFKRSQQA